MNLLGNLVTAKEDVEKKPSRLVCEQSTVGDLIIHCTAIGTK